MMLPTRAGAAAAALLTVALGAPMANAADTRTASPATPAAASDCWWSHYYDGYWHHHSKLLCDHDYSYGTDNDDYYYRAHPHFNGGDNRGFEHDRMGHTPGTGNDAGTVNNNTDRGTTDRGTTDRGTTDRGTTDRGTTDRGDRGTGGTGNTGNTDRGTGTPSGSNNTGGGTSGGGVRR
jgi:hypothetical protein